MKSTLSATLLCLTAVAFTAPDVDAQVVQLDSGLGTAYYPQVAADSGRVYAAWSDTGVGYDVYFAYSVDNGVTYSAPMKIDSDTTGAQKNLYKTSVVADGNDVYVLWQDRRDDVTGTNDNVYCVASHDGGVTFGPDVRIDDTGTPGQYDTIVAKMAASGLNVYITLLVDGPGGSTYETAFATYSNDGGTTFASATQISNGTAGTDDVDWVAIDCYGDNAFAAFAQWGGSTEQDNVYGVAFDKNGVYQPVARVDSAVGVAGDFEWDVHVSMTSATDVHVCWDEERLSASNEEVRYNRSTDGGLTFGTDMKIGSYTTGADIDGPWMDASGSTVVVGWHDDTTFTDEVSVAVSTDGGVTFGADIVISSGGGQWPRVVIDGPYVAVAYLGPAFPEDAWMAWSNDGGATFGAPIVMSTSPADGDADWAEVAVDQTTAACHTVFLDDASAVNNAYASSFVDTGGPGTAYCFGNVADGNPCPCGNDNDGTTPKGGCAHDDSAAGARLDGSGIASVTSDTLLLEGSRGPISNSTLFFQANNNLDGNGSFLGDGIRCAGGGLIRLKVKMTDASGYADSSPQVITLRSASFGHVIVPGETLYYQWWIRDPGGSPCGNENNTSNGYMITWLP